MIGRWPGTVILELYAFSAQGKRILATIDVAEMQFRDLQRAVMLSGDAVIGILLVGKDPA